MKACLERKLRKRIPEEHPLMSWLVELTALLLIVRLRGAESKTELDADRSASA